MLPARARDIDAFNLLPNKSKTNKRIRFDGCRCWLASAVETIRFDLISSFNSFFFCCFVAFFLFGPRIFVYFFTCRRLLLFMFPFLIGALSQYSPLKFFLIYFSPFRMQNVYARHTHLQTKCMYTCVCIRTQSCVCVCVYLQAVFLMFLLRSFSALLSLMCTHSVFMPSPIREVISWTG